MTPTKPGYYWATDATADDDSEPEIVLVIRVTGRLMVQRCGSNWPLVLSAFEDYRGPLKPVAR